MPDCRTEYLVTRNKQFFCMTIFFLFLSLSVKSQTVSVADFFGDRQAAVSLTFDDGIQEHYTLVAPHLNRYALRGTFGINGKLMTILPLDSLGKNVGAWWLTVTRYVTILGVIQT